MRLTTSAQTAAVRTATTPSTTAAAKPAAEAKSSRVSAQAGHSIVDGGCFPPRPPLPHPLPLPPIVKQTADAKVRAGQGDQLHDIANGVRNGSVTAQESETLLKEQQKIAQATQKAMADGKLSLGERLNLAVMQARADAHIDEATHNSSRSPLAALSPTAQQQANQIDQVAKGRTNGTITNTEAGELLGQQVEISDARGDADSSAEQLALGGKLSQADKEIAKHSAPGTQWDFKPFPHPLPLPHPLPFPRPLPLPELPRPFPRELPSKPTYEVPSFRNSAIVG